MAGIRHRRRPRVHSVNFRRLWWVLLREVALRVWGHALIGTVHEKNHRAFILRQRPQELRAIITTVITTYPARRFWPPEGAA